MIKKRHFETAVFHNKFKLCQIKPNQIHSFFYFVWKETTLKPLKVTATKTLFSSVYVLVDLASEKVSYSMW